MDEKTLPVVNSISDFCMLADCRAKLTISKLQEIEKSKNDEINDMRAYVTRIEKLMVNMTDQEKQEIISQNLRAKSENNLLDIKIKELQQTIDKQQSDIAKLQTNLRDVNKEYIELKRDVIESETQYAVKLKEYRSLQAALKRLKEYEAITRHQLDLYKEQFQKMKDELNPTLDYGMKVDDPFTKKGFGIKLPFMK